MLAPLGSEEGASIRADIDRTVSDFGELFVDIKKQRDQMGRIMTVFRDFKEETERLSDWMQQADINIKAAKTSLLGKSHIWYLPKGPSTNGISYIF